MWIARAYMVLAAQGLSRVHQYMLRDVQSDGWVQFSTSGMVTSPDDTPYPWAPKPAWWVRASVRACLRVRACVMCRCLRVCVRVCVRA